MAYFNKDYLAFFAELEEYNSKEWFDENRDRYHKEVREPFKAFTEDLIDSLRPFHPNLETTASEAMMRINRDIRFSKDKTPYKIHMAAGVSPGGKKNYAVPGLYVQANHHDLRIYSGAHELDKDQLQNLRYHIAAESDTFARLLERPLFKEHFGGIHGEKNKRLSAELSEAAAQQPLLFNKNFYYFSKFPPSTILAEDLVTQVCDRYAIVQELNDFLLEGIFPEGYQ